MCETTKLIESNPLAMRQLMAIIVEADRIRISVVKMLEDKHECSTEKLDAG